MSAERFFPMKVQCPTCSRETTILDVSFSEKGAIKLSLICVLEGKELTLHTSWDKVICFCHEAGEIQRATVFEAVPTIQ